MSGMVPNILWVEDDPSDVELMQEAFDRANLRVNLHVVGDGEQAIAYLRRETPYEKALPPDLILLDFNLPRADGRECLREIKSDERFKSIPVIVFTTSGSDADIQRSYCLGANCFITKPLRLNELFEVIKSLGLFWFKTVNLPRAGCL